MSIAFDFSCARPIAGTANYVMMTKLQRNDVMDVKLPLKFSTLKKVEIAYFHKHRQESVFGNKDELIKRCVGCD